MTTTDLYFYPPCLNKCTGMRNNVLNRQFDSGWKARVSVVRQDRQQAQTTRRRERTAT